jgi:hypothetical protein
VFNVLTGADLKEYFDLLQQQTPDPILKKRI